MFLDIWLRAKQLNWSKSAIELMAVVTILALPSLALADDDDDAGSTNKVKRPIEELFQNEVVFPQEKGEIEVEVASAYSHRPGNDTWIIPLGLEYGLTDCWQVDGEWNSLVQHYSKNQGVSRGIGDFEVGTQYSFLNIEGSPYHIAPRFSLQVPVGDVNRDFSDGFIEYEPEIILARDVAAINGQVFTDIGLDLVQRAKMASDPEDREPAAHEFDWGMGFYTLFPHGAASLEFNWENNRWNNNGTENQIYLTPGILWKVNRHMELGIGIPVGLTTDSDRFGVLAHCVYEF